MRLRCLSSLFLVGMLTACDGATPELEFVAGRPPLTDAARQGVAEVAALARQHEFQILVTTEVQGARTSTIGPARTTQFSDRDLFDLFEVVPVPGGGPAETDREVVSERFEVSYYSVASSGEGILIAEVFFKPGDSLSVGVLEARAPQPGPPTHRRQSRITLTPGNPAAREATDALYAELRRKARSVANGGPYQ